MERRNGVKIGYLAIILAIPTSVIKIIGLIYSIVDSLVVIDFSLQIIIGVIFLFSLILIGMLASYTIQTLRKPELIEEQYKYPGRGIIVGLSFCIPILLVLVFQGQFMFGDVITSLMFFFIGILFIISGIIMVQEVKGGMEQIQAE